MTCFGMSLRDYFAAAALPACIERSLHLARESAAEDRLEHIVTTMDRAACWAYQGADAMLAVRNPQPTE